MKNTTYTYNLLFAVSIFALSIIISGCFNDLDTVPIDEDIITSEVVYDDPSSYKKVLAKLYAGLSVTGQQGPAGDGDIEGIDEGFGQYLRMLWYHQELTTEEAVIGWNDQTIKDFHEQDWLAEDGFIFAMYSRIYYQIPICNEFLRETTDAKLDSRGVDGALRTEIAQFRSEARFLRALSYWHALDLFRNVPFVTEEDAVGAFFPEQIQAADLFDFIESELLDIEGQIVGARQNEYGRADQGAVWALLAKLYLNAEVYTGNARWSSCTEYCEKLINSSYTLDSNYGNLFLADNYNTDEIIFPIIYDGVTTRTWGGTTFIINAGIGGLMNAADSGVSGGWGGTRTTRQMVEKFGSTSDLGGVLIDYNPGNTVQYPKVYTPGSFQGFDYSDTNNALSSINSDNVFEGYKYFPEDNGEFLVTRIPDSSAPYFGDNGNDGTLDQFGSNITVGPAGLYYIKADLNENTIEFDRQEWGILGDATTVGWDSDIDLVFDAEKNALRTVITTTDGFIKFRANDAWDLNLGDDGADGLLEFGGADIAVPAGEYEILLNLNRPDYNYKISSVSFDRRPFFFSDGQTLDIADVTTFTEGYAINKFKNLNADGSTGSDNTHADTDFPVFRLADFYLMAAESIMRSGGDLSKALEYVNLVRTRAYGSTAGGIDAADLSLDFLLDERARELYWECHRRTDLVRFGQFTDGDYLWQWKGGVFDGVQVPSFRNVFPIPSADIGANLNLIQNEGY